MIHPDRDPVAAARGLLERAVAAHVFPAAAAEVGDRHGPLWTDAVGTLTFDTADSATSATPFDLASLTKPIATTSLALDLFSQRNLDLTEPVAAACPEWRGADREAATIQDLLEHASGLPARLLDAPPDGRREFEHEICSTPLEYVPRTRSIYSDLDFILLGFIVEDHGGLSLSAQFDALVARLAGSGVSEDVRMLTFGVPLELRHTAAPTEPMDADRRRGRQLRGEVHDNYAAALGGVAGHAGLFGSSRAVGAFARAVLQAAHGAGELASPLTPKLVARATRKTAVPGSSRALGWDTMLPTSSCGTEMSPAAFGHVGFTGTSLWIDPILDRYFVLLTNRACGGGTSEEMQTVRRTFHNLLAKL